MLLTVHAFGGKWKSQTTESVHNFLGLEMLNCFRFDLNSRHVILIFPRETMQVVCPYRPTTILKKFGHIRTAHRENFDTANCWPVPEIKVLNNYARDQGTTGSL